MSKERADASRDEGKVKDKNRTDDKPTGTASVITGYARSVRLSSFSFRSFVTQAHDSFLSLTRLKLSPQPVMSQALASYSRPSFTSFSSRSGPRSGSRHSENEPKVSERGTEGT